MTEIKLYDNGSVIIKDIDDCYNLVFVKKIDYIEEQSDHNRCCIHFSGGDEMYVPDSFDELIIKLRLGIPWPK